MAGEMMNGGMKGGKGMKGMRQGPDGFAPPPPPGPPPSGWGKGKGFMDIPPWEDGKGHKPFKSTIATLPKTQILRSAEELVPT